MKKKELKKKNTRQRDEGNLTAEFLHETSKLLVV